MIDVLERRKQRSMLIVASSDNRYRIQRWRDASVKEWLQVDGQTWDTVPGEGWVTVEEAREAAKPYWPETIVYSRFSMDMDDLIEIFHEAGYPTEGHLAEWLWRLMSSNTVAFSSSDAANVYRALGYEPFEGYPLKRRS